MRQEFPGQPEAERLLAADAHRRQGVRLVGQHIAVPCLVVRKRGILFVPQEIQIPRYRAAGHLEKIELHSVKVETADFINEFRTFA
ncbi:MAG: hypothetical protein ACI97B_003481 [Verrucomicrobiales bacterium]|jgi:hypothetical protein